MIHFGAIAVFASVAIQGDMLADQGGAEHAAYLCLGENATGFNYTTVGGWTPTLFETSSLVVRLDQAAGRWSVNRHGDADFMATECVESPANRTLICGLGSFSQFIFHFDVLRFTRSSQGGYIQQESIPAALARLEASGEEYPFLAAMAEGNPDSMVLEYGSCSPV